MNVSGPPIKDPAVTTWMQNIRAAFGLALSKNEATPRLLLMSSGEKVYAVTVSDAGALTTTLIDGKTRDA
jgi:hypothetical protein